MVHLGKWSSPWLEHMNNLYLKAAHMFKSQRLYRTTWVNECLIFLFASQGCPIAWISTTRPDWYTITPALAPKWQAIDAQHSQEEWVTHHLFVLLKRYSDCISFYVDRWGNVITNISLKFLFYLNSSCQSFLLTAHSWVWKDCIFFYRQ